MRPHEYVFTYEDLARATGLSRNAISQHVVRGHLDAEDICSLAAYLARYGTDEVRTEIMKALLRRDVPNDPGGWQAKKKGKKKR